MIFVFGSNTGGIHGAGAARTAYKEHGARWGMSYGHYGDSFAIPTKGCVITADGQSTKVEVGSPLSLVEIHQYSLGFLAYAQHHPELTFKVTRIGCGLAGFTDRQIAPLFHRASTNCQFDTAWKDILGDKYTYWGHG